METRKLSEKKALIPWEVAKDLIRVSMLKNGYVDLQVKDNLCKLTPDASAHIKAKTKQIVVTNIYGIDIWIEIPIYKIMKEILKEAIENLTPDSKVIHCGEKSKSSF